MRNIFKSPFLLTVALLAFSNLCFSQSSGSSSSAAPSNTKLFTEWGFAPFTSYEQTPYVTYVNYVPNSGFLGSYAPPGWTAQPAQKNYFTGIDFFAFVFRVRYNLTEFGNNSSLSVSAMPDIAVGMPATGVGLGSLNVPLLIEYNIGNVSTYTTDQNHGFVIAAGIEFTDAPIFLFQATEATGSNGETYTVNTPTAWVEPTVEIGYRHWNKRNKAKEINLKGGMGAKGSFAVRLCWMKCIGY